MAETMAELEVVSMEDVTEASTSLEVTLESKSESFVTEGKCCSQLFLLCCFTS